MYEWEQMIHVSYSRRGSREQEVVVSAIYGSPNAANRTALWTEIKRLARQTTLPWILIGDFNSILRPADRMGGAGYQEARVQQFRSCVNVFQLHEVGFVGPSFTWRRWNLSQRLDRALCNRQWLLKFPDVTTKHLARVGSDHRPILALSAPPRQNRRDRPYRFLAAWLGHENFPRALLMHGLAVPICWGSSRTLLKTCRCGIGRCLGILLDARDS
ncbi:unnamed protein product [Linum trigynum]|uniref:Endonuclease/exonuclease/phosphatase domain-containing protein n=1 Tax=Linum trigynum TaxID=586398 RepID=A0AAV2FSU4_9ROSI